MNTDSPDQDAMPVYTGIASKRPNSLQYNTRGYSCALGPKSPPAIPGYSGIATEKAETSQDRGQISVEADSTRHTPFQAGYRTRAFPGVRKAKRKMAGMRNSTIISRVLAANSERLHFSLSATEIDYFLHGILKLSATVTRWRANHG